MINSILRRLFLLSLVLPCLILNGCSSSKSASKNDRAYNFVIAGEIKLEDPVFMFIKFKNKHITLVTTKTNAVRYSKSEIALDELLRFKNVYLRGGNPFIFEDIHFRKYPNLGTDPIGSREVLSQDVTITHITTNCFLLAFLDHKTYQNTQLELGDSHFFESNHDWMFLKFAFTMDCPIK